MCYTRSKLSLIRYPWEQRAIMRMLRSHALALHRQCDASIWMTATMHHHALQPPQAASQAYSLTFNSIWGFQEHLTSQNVDFSGGFHSAVTGLRIEGAQGSSLRSPPECLGPLRQSRQLPAASLWSHLCSSHRPPATTCVMREAENELKWGLLYTLLRQASGCRARVCHLTSPDKGCVTKSSHYISYYITPAKK